MVNAQESKNKLPPITTPFDVYAYEDSVITLWRLEPGVFRVVEILTWNGNVMWRSIGYGDAVWAFQDSVGHEVGEGFYRIRVEKADGVYWASMNVHWQQHIAIIEDQGHSAVVLSAGPNYGTGFSVTVTNNDTTTWKLTELSWSNGTTEPYPIPISYSAVYTAAENAVVLLPNGANAYRVRFISPTSVYLDSISFEIETESVMQPEDSVDLEP